MLLRTKLADCKQCPSCGWLMRLTVDLVQPLAQSDDCARNQQRCYECVNKACEHVERVALGSLGTRLRGTR